MIMNLSLNSIFLENILLSKTRLDRIKISTYLLCKYNDQYWIGIVPDIDEATGDVKVKFMHPHYPGISFFWLSQKKGLLDKNDCNFKCLESTNEIFYI